MIIAAIVYFVFVLPMKTIQERRKRGEEAGPAEPTDVEVLIEIRDLLRQQQSQMQPVGRAAIRSRAARRASTHRTARAVRRWVTVDRPATPVRRRVAPARATGERRSTRASATECAAIAGRPATGR